MELKFSVDKRDVLPLKIKEDIKPVKTKKTKKISKKK